MDSIPTYSLLRRIASPRIGTVIGSTRPTRFGDNPAAWIRGIAGKRTDHAFKVTDLRGYPSPLFDEPGS
jgi:NAD(P)H-dependent FMN reductase